MNKNYFILVFLFIAFCGNIYSQNRLANTTWETIIDGQSRQTIVFGETGFRWTGEAWRTELGTVMPGRNEVGTYRIQGEMVYLDIPGFTYTGILLRDTLNISMGIVGWEFRQITAQTHFDRGMVYFNRANWDAAILEFSEAIRLNPNFAEAYDKRANVYMVRRDSQRTFSDLNQAIRINPNFAEAYNSRGVAYSVLMGDNERAIADYTQAIRINSNFAEAYNNRGFLYASMGDYERAISDFEAALRINPRELFARERLESARQELIKEYAQADLQRLIDSARVGGNVPEDLSFMIVIAGERYRNSNLRLPETWNARMVLEAFASRNDALNAIERRYMENMRER